MIEKLYYFISVEVDKHHVGVYASRSNGHMVKDEHPKASRHGSLVSPSFATVVMNRKYVNTVPLYDMKQEFIRYGLSI